MSSHLPLAAADILLPLCLALTKPLSFSTGSACPCLPPTWKLLGLDWSVERARGKDPRPHAAFCLQQQLLCPRGCQVAVLPGKHV